MPENICFRATKHVFEQLDTVYCEDCSAGIDRIPDRSVDLVVTDPPYQLDVIGAGAFGSNHKLYHHDLIGLDKGISDELILRIIRKCKRVNAYFWCNKNQLAQYYRLFDSLGLNIDLLTWHKTNPTPASNNKYLSDTEYLIFVREKGVPLYGTYETKKKFYVSGINREDKNEWDHPTIKPLEIIKNIIVNSSPADAIVLDPFIGSGTTAVACIESDRHYIGFEISEKYCEIAAKRISEANHKMAAPFSHARQTSLASFQEVS